MLEQGGKTHIPSAEIKRLIKQSVRANQMHLINSSSVKVKISESEGLGSLLVLEHSVMHLHHAEVKNILIS